MIQAVPLTSVLEKPPARGHLDYIDGFRGLAILMVLLFHAWVAAHSPAAYWWNPLYSAAWGVNLFLLLSGFCLYWPLVRPGRPSPEPTLAEFARRRAHRILPPYYIALAIFTLWATVLQMHGWAEPQEAVKNVSAILQTVAWHILMLHNLRPEQIFAINPPFWSLPLEVSLYVAMPILVVIARLRGIVWAVIFAAVVTLSYRIFWENVVGGKAQWDTEPTLHMVVVNFLPGRLVEFALGMWAATLIAGGLRGRRTPLGLLALLCLALAAWITERCTKYSPLPDAICGLGFFFLILKASQTPSMGTSPWRSLGAAFRVRPLVWLGQMSYSLYLIHQPIIEFANTIFARLFHRDLLIFAANLALFVPITGLAFVFHLYFERPFMNGPRRLSVLKEISSALL